MSESPTPRHLIDITGGEPGTMPRILLSVKYEDGRLVFKYDPADLDEAGRRFVAHCQRLADEQSARAKEP